jgi:8-oxo-dGTP pyrophosphatase MutT (NUDIX family)
MLRKLWTDFISLILQRPSRYQVAALCWREAGHGKAGAAIEILLISSRTTKRWILPKGWPKTGQDAAGTALEEAWEEAGIRIDGPPPQKIGRYSYRKRLEGGVPVHTVVDVYAIHADRLLDIYPEAGQRDRQWFSPEKAAQHVQEPDLASLLRNSSRLIATLPS